MKKGRMPVTPPDDPSAALQARDLERINAAAASLNAEATDVLQYQARTEP